MSQLSTLNIIGCGGNTKVLCETLKLIGISNLFFFDDSVEYFKFGESFCFDVSRIHDGIIGDSIISIGDNSVRKSIRDRLTKVRWRTIIHPSAIISSNVIIGEGSIIMAGAILQSGVKLGKHCIINTGAIIDHDCIIGDFVHIAPNSSLAGGVKLGDGVFVGIGSSLIPMVSVGNWALIGAGSVVINDVMSNSQSFGVPSKHIKFLNNFEK